MLFKDLKIGQEFYFGGDRTFTSFNDRCKKVSPRKYISVFSYCENTQYKVGSVNVEVLEILL